MIDITEIFRLFCELYIINIIFSNLAVINIINNIIQKYLEGIISTMSNYITVFLNIIYNKYRFDIINERIGNLEVKVDKINERVGNLEVKVDKIEVKVDILASNMSEVKLMLQTLIKRDYNMQKN